MKIEFSSNYGNFDYTLRATIGDDVNPETVLLCKEQGLGNLGYRVCGSSVDKAFGVKGKNPVYDKRTDVLYSAENAKVMSTAVEAAIAKLVQNEPLYGKLGLTVEITGEHVASEGSAGPGKMATAMAFLVMGNADALAKLGLDEDSSEEEVVRALQAKLAASRKPRTAKAVEAVEAVVAEAAE